MQHSFEDIVQLWLGVFVVHYSAAKVWEVRRNALRVATDRVAQALVCLVLLVVVVFQVTQTDAPLLRDFLQVDGDGVGVDQTQAAQGYGDVLGQGFVQFFRAEDYC
jgi:hypothetical protein